MTVNPFGMRNAEGSTMYAKGAIKVYPSPTSGNITVETPANGILNVYTIDGKLLKQYTIEAPASAILLPTNVAAGIYMCHFEGNDGSAVVVRIVYNP
jgi:hypothetical protein